MSVETPTVLSERVARRGVRLFSAAVLCFLVAPILIIVPLSFNRSTYFSYPLTGVTLGWYEMIASSAEWRAAIVNSFVIGLSATAIATLLGTLAAIGISRPRFPFHSRPRSTRWW